MPTTKDISPKQYADWKGCSVQYIHRILLSGELAKLPHVQEVKRYSRFYTLQVPATLTQADFKIIATK